MLLIMGGCLIVLSAVSPVYHLIDYGQYKNSAVPAIIVTMETIQKQLGQRLQQARRGKGWTQEDLAHHAGLDFSYVNQLENGKRNPSLETLYKIATALGVPLKDLIPD